MATNLGLAARNYEIRRRRRTMAIVLGLALFGTWTYFAFELGRLDGGAEVLALRQRLDQVEDVGGQRQREVDQLRIQLRTAQAQTAEWQERHKREVPTGKLKEIVDQVAAKMTGGLTAERFANVVALINPQPQCDARPATKRLGIKTPVGDVPAASIGFADILTVTGEGLPTVDTAGRKNAWFDPAQQVTIRIAGPAGRNAEIGGILPLQRSLIIGDSEYRFSIVNGPRSFVNVTVERCAFP